MNHTEFIALYESHLSGMMVDGKLPYMSKSKAYEIAESDCIAATGSRMFGSYKAFCNCVRRREEYGAKPSTVRSGKDKPIRKVVKYNKEFESKFNWIF